MDDIVVRLRARIKGPESCDVRWNITRDLADAADEIERLRIENSNFRGFTRRVAEAAGFKVTSAHSASAPQSEE